MSYDLVFLNKDPGQPWAEALAVDEEEPAGHPVPQVWEAIVAGARDVLGDIAVYEKDATRELTHEPSAIQVHHGPHRTVITVPYWYTEEKAEIVVRALYRMGQVVTAATGHPGYDPQLEVPVVEAEARVDDAVAVFDRAAALLREMVETGGAGHDPQGEASPTGAESQADAAVAVVDQADALLTETEETEETEHCHVYFAGNVGLAEARQQLGELVVTAKDDELTVRWDDDGPTMWVTLSAAPEVVEEAAEIARTYRLPGIAGLDRRFEVRFEDLDEVLDEINTLIEVQACLEDLTGGYVVRSWNDQITRPEDRG